MLELSIHSSAPMALPACAVTIRAGTMADLPFIDYLQKKNNKQVGFFPTKAIEGKIELGHVLVAEEVMSDECGVMNEEGSSHPPFITHHSSFSTSTVGYCIGTDQYFKRDDVGIIYQMNVLPGRQRGLIGASLLKAQFERSAYGCKLYCCWCAQDIEANGFWEAMGFVPLAYRVGSELKGPKDENGNHTPRVHIFWQKRIRHGDVTTPWWFPSKTNSGAIREDRIVLPIPPGTHWRNAKPMVLPGNDECGMMSDESGKASLELPLAGRKKKPVVLAKPGPLSIAGGGLWFEAAKKEEPAPEPRRKVKNDPRLIAAARELRDRWLERVNGGEVLLSGGKYEVSRMIGEARGDEGRLLLAA